MRRRKREGQATRRSTGWLSRILLLGLCLLVVAGLSGLSAYAASARGETWTSSASVVYGLESSDRLFGSSTSSGDVQRTLATQAQVVLGDSVMTAASEQLGIGRQRLVRATTVVNLTDSNVLRISVEAGSGDAATRRAQVVTDQYVANTQAVARAGFADQAAALDAPIAQLRTIIGDSLTNNPRFNPAALNNALTGLLQQQLQLQAAAASETGPVQVLAGADSPRGPSSIGTPTAAVIGAGLGIVVVVGTLLALFFAGRRRFPLSARPAARS